MGFILELLGCIWGFILILGCLGFRGKCRVKLELLQNPSKNPTGLTALRSEGRSRQPASLSLIGLIGFRAFIGFRV